MHTDPRTIYVLAAMNAIHEARLEVYKGSLEDALESAHALALALEPVGEPVTICKGLLRIENQEYDHFWCKMPNNVIIDVTADLYFARFGPLIGHEEIFDKAYFEVSTSFDIDRTPSAISAAAEATLAAAREQFEAAIDAEKEKLAAE